MNNGLVEYGDDSTSDTTADCGAYSDPLALRTVNSCSLLLQPLRKTVKPSRPKVQCEWGHEDILTLIQAVKERPNLWALTNYRFKEGKETLWQEIDNIVGNIYGPDECKAKWGNLRVSFKFNIAKYRNTRSASSVRKQIAWKYFPFMLFLEESSVHNAPPMPFSMVDDDDDDRSMLTTDNNSTTPPASCRPEREMRPTSPTPSDSSAFNKVHQQPTAKDEFSAFGEFVTAELRSIQSAERAAYVKRKLNRALADLMDESESMAVGMPPSPPSKQQANNKVVGHLAPSLQNIKGEIDRQGEESEQNVSDDSERQQMTASADKYQTHRRRRRSRKYKRRRIEIHLADTITDISQSFATILNGRSQPNSHIPPSDIKYTFMWQNLERLFKRFTDDDIDELNYQFITLTRNKMLQQKIIIN